MERGYYYYTVEVKIEPSHEATDNFDINDRNYYDGSLRIKPPDFYLHLALYLFQKELLPEAMLEPLREWTRNNKMLVI